MRLALTVDGSGAHAFRAAGRGGELEAPSAIRAEVQRLLVEAAAVEITERDVVTLELPLAQREPEAILELLRRLDALAAALTPAAGPYR
jgi:hypothetical protein